MEFITMDIDTNSHKRPLEADPVIDNALHIAKKARQAAADASVVIAIESLPSPPSEHSSAPASEAPSPAPIAEDIEMHEPQSEATSAPSPAPSQQSAQPGSLNRSLRLQRYLRQGYPMSWLVNLN